MINEKQVEFVIIPLAQEHSMIIVINIIILSLTTILIYFYRKQSFTIKTIERF